LVAPPPSPWKIHWPPHHQFLLTFFFSLVSFPFSPLFLSSGSLRPGTFSMNPSSMAPLPFPFPSGVSFCRVVDPRAVSLHYLEFPTGPAQSGHDLDLPFLHQLALFVTSRPSVALFSPPSWTGFKYLRVRFSSSNINSGHVFGSLEDEVLNLPPPPFTNPSFFDTFPRDLAPPNLFTPFFSVVVLSSGIGVFALSSSVESRPPLHCYLPCRLPLRWIS